MMVELTLDFAKEKPLLAWCFAWGVWVIPAIIAIPFNWSFKIYNRWMRSRNIASAGWPSHPLMDADGDIVHPPEEEKE